MNRPQPPADDRGDVRRDQGVKWASQHIEKDPLGHDAVAGDASFRRYFRLRSGTDSWILMDAPPDREDCRPFVDIAARLGAAGLHAPRVLAADLDQGYLLLEDFGDQLLRGILTTNNADAWMPRLFDALERMAGGVSAQGLPAYDRQALLTELELFPRWYLERHKGLRLSCEDWDVWEALCTRLILSAQEQPQVFVHRDFHSSNLLRTPGGELGIIDFQDAVHGPLSYDFVSLVWDRYIAWPRTRLDGWMEDGRQRLAPNTDPTTWMRWCDWMGLQRNLKVAGIFARLRYRDGKIGYLEMIPRFWGYIQDQMPRYPEFDEFHQLLERLGCAP